MSLEIYEQYKFFIYLGGHVKKQMSYRKYSKVWNASW